jgi:diguanylate cyclase
MTLAAPKYILCCLTPVLLFISSPALAQSSFADRTNMTWDGAITGMFLGLLAFSVAYNAAFFSILRERFLVWQSVRAIIFFALTIGLSPLAMGEFFATDSQARQVYINILFDLSVAVSGPFLRTYIEPGMLSRRIDRALSWIPAFVMLTTPAMLIADCPPAYMAIRNAVMVGTLVLVCTALTQAWRRGSRTARFQSTAWSSVLAVYGISLFHDIVLGRPFTMLLFALFAALGLEVILTAIGIGDRFVRLKREHDEARAMATALQVIAHTDPLTGLRNRRAIEQAFCDSAPTAIALVDIDVFKTVNDRYGHDIGDRVIVATGSALNSGDAVAGRIGGEEFVVLLYSDVAEVREEAERLRLLVESAASALVPGLSSPVTASMGLAFATTDAGFSTILKVADLNLYTAKRNGRNRLVSPAPEQISIAA